MDNLNVEREKIDSTKRHLQIACCIISIFIAIFSLVGYIIIAITIQGIIDAYRAEGLPTSDLAGYCALIFFVILFGAALFIYLIYILKEYLQVRLCYCNDIKSVRESMLACSKRLTIQMLKSDEDKQEKIERTRNTSPQLVDEFATIATKNDAICLWNRKKLAYVFDVVADENGDSKIIYSVDGGKSFNTNAEAMSFLYNNTLWEIEKSAVL
ncbi:MAG: hypothetical protein NC037_02690 [Bacteroides sp.]|nr:hypothetical protein [Bacillota bacterium]MCM1393277.1 hypothetical protein [[Eubacterium] siraeum]MCM1455420.1 hypothetical protein [Bacteroides sp.]